MNIVEAYIEFNGQLVIFISGINGCRKTPLAKNIARDFKIKMLNQYNYYKNGYDKKVTLADGTEVVNWYSDDAIDWKEFNEDIDRFRTTGVIVTGMSFPPEKMKVKSDFHVHLKISKQECINLRRNFLEENKEKFRKEYELIGTQTEKLIMNQIIYSYNIESIKKMKIDKFVSVDDMDDDKIYDVVFDDIVQYIQNYLKNYNKQKSETVPNDKNQKVQIEILDEPKYLYDIENQSDPSNIMQNSS